MAGKRWHPRHPHELPTLVLHPDHADLADPDDHAALADLHASEFFAEPPERSGEWGPSLVRRLIGVSTGMVACGALTQAQRARLEAAGVLCCTEDADLVEAAEASWPALRTLRRLRLGFGSPRPTVVLCGDRPNRPGQLPFAARCGTWLLAAIRALGHDELTIYLCNAVDHAKRRYGPDLARLRDAFAACSPTWIALGRTAERELKREGVEARYCPHPAHHRRWHHDQGPVGYARLLREAGLEPGPWLDREAGAPELPARVEVRELPELPPPYDLRSMGHVSGRSKPRRAKRGPDLDPARVEAARRAYVVGEAPSVRAAAEAMGISVQKLQQHARRHDWAAERLEHERAKTRAAKQRAQEAEAKAIASSRQLAWAATTKALHLLAQRLEREDFAPSPRDVEALARTASMLSGVESPERSPEEEALARMPLADLLERAKQQIERIGGTRGKE